MRRIKRRSELRVPSYLCDEHDRLTLPGLAGIFQEEAWLHARELGFDLTDPNEGLFWVLARVVWHVRRLPRWDQQLVVHTWPAGMERLLALREFTIHDATDEHAEPLVLATSAWIIMDAVTQRPVRPQQRLDARMALQERVLPIALAKVSAPPLETTPKFTTGYHHVRAGAIDRNKHVNNTAYLQWMVDALSANGVAAELEGADRALVVHYLSETRRDDSYRVIGGPNGAWVCTRSGAKASASSDASGHESVAHNGGNRPAARGGNSGTEDDTVAASLRFASLRDLPTL